MADERVDDGLDPADAALLRAVAADPDADTPRLVPADRLDEHGDAPRAEFIRVPRVPAGGGRDDARRQALRARERDLLDAHRAAWVQAVGQPAEDVQLERGLVARPRPVAWDGGRRVAQRLATLSERDLSGMQLGDAGMAGLTAAKLPTLRKLILADNGITAAGVGAFAGAAGLPRLDTLYRFGNPVSAADVRAALGRSPHFRLTNLDVGERAEGYCMSPGQTELARRQYVRTQLLPVVGRYFGTYERLRPAVLCVARYRADETDDAVHGGWW